MQAKEFTIFDKNGKPTAYIDTADEFTIYMWDGTPVAYLYEDEQIYGFNGKHLGWFIEGIIWNQKGDAEGFIEGALKIATSLETFKGFKEFKPFESMKKMASSKPSFSGQWARLSLEFFLTSGQK